MSGGTAGFVFPASPLSRLVRVSETSASRLCPRLILRSQTQGARLCHLSPIYKASLGLAREANYSLCLQSTRNLQFRRITLILQCTSKYQQKSCSREYSKVGMRKYCLEVGANEG